MSRTQNIKAFQAKAMAFRRAALKMENLNAVIRYVKQAQRCDDIRKALAN